MMQEVSPLSEPTLDTLLYSKRELSHENYKHILLAKKEQSIQIECEHLHYSLTILEIAQPKLISCFII